MLIKSLTYMYKGNKGNNVNSIKIQHLLLNDKET